MHTIFCFWISMVHNAYKTTNNLSRCNWYKCIKYQFFFAWQQFYFFFFYIGTYTTAVDVIQCMPKQRCEMHKTNIIIIIHKTTEKNETSEAYFRLDNDCEPMLYVVTRYTLLVVLLKNWINSLLSALLQLFDGHFFLLLLHFWTIDSQ